MKTQGDSEPGGIWGLKRTRYISVSVPKVIKRGTPIAPSSQSSTSARPAPLSAPGGRKRIIEREVVGATHEAAEIRRRAEDEAQRIIEEAHEQAAETRQHGFEEGKQEALARYTRDIAAALARVRQIEAELEPLYIGLVQDCCEKIIGQELQVNPDAILGVVRNALSHARQQREILVRVNPADVEVLQRNRNKLLEMLARAQSVEIREDASIGRGGCVVVTELGAIEANLERQLEALASVLQDELRESLTDAAGHRDLTGDLAADPMSGGSSSGAYGQESDLDPEDDPGYGEPY